MIERLRLNLILTTALTAFSLASWLPAALVVYEPFDYSPTGATDGDGSAFGDDTPHNGGIGFDGSWSQSGGDNEFEVTSPGLTFTDGSSNELAVGGNSIVRPDRGGTRAASRSLASGSTTALTGNDSTIWMSFLFEPRTTSGYNGLGPDAAITIASTTANGAANDHSLSASGYGVGIVVEDVGGSGPKVVSTGYYNGTTSVSKDASTLVPTPNQVSLLVAKIVWSTDDSSSDEIFVFNITDITSEPAEIDAIASATFDMSSANQATIDTLNISDTQTNAIDEIRIGTSFAAVVPIPEPSSFTLIGVVGLVLLARRRRH
jgi:hypothetical protein